MPRRDSMDDQRSLGKELVDYILRLGASACDVLVADTKHVSAEAENSSIKQASMIHDSGVAMRAFARGCSGFSYSTSLDRQSLRRVAKLAMSQARAGTPDSQFKGLPERQRQAQVEGLYDSRLSRLQPDEVVEMLIRLVDKASEDKRITSVNAGVGVSISKITLCNSNGFCGSQSLSSHEMGVESVARSGDRMFSGTDGGWTRKLDKAMLDMVATSSMDNAIRGLVQKKIGTGDYPVIMDPLAAGYILSGAIGGGANAESVQRGRSYLGDKLGIQVAGENVSIMDDPTYPWAAGSFSFDGEGTPARRKAVIHKGVLATYLHDSYTAGKASVESTGNSSRGEPIWSFRRPPSIASSNLILEKGDASLDEMLEETPKGVYLRITFDHPNIATGEFSGLMMESFLVENGSLGPSIRQATMGIGILELLSSIDMIGKKTRDAYGMRTPAIRIEKARIGGSG